MVTRKISIMQILTIVVLAISVLFLVVSVLALIDPNPADSKLADDGDPFGTPPSRLSSGIEVAVSGIVIAGCIVFLNRRRNSG